MKKRLLALFLTMVMLFSLFPASAFAVGELEETGVIPMEEAATVAEEGETGVNTAEERAEVIPDPASEEAPVGVAPGMPTGELPVEENLGGDGVLDSPFADLNALPEAPAADEIQATIASGSCGKNLTWSLENNVLTISGSGAMTSWSSKSNTPWYNYRETIAKIVLPNGMTSIGDYAFYGCKYVTSVDIPAGVTRIGYYAFEYCSSLTNVEIPEGLTIIGDYTFRYCSSLAYVEIPGSVTRIGECAFFGCSSLTNVKIPSSMISHVQCEGIIHN